MRQLLLALVLPISLVGRASAQQDTTPGDTQFRPSFEVKVPVVPMVDLRLTGQLRVGENVTRLAEERTGIGVIIKPARFLEVEPFYLFADAQPDPGRSEREHRFGIDLTPQAQFRGFAFSDRNRYEHREIGDRRDASHRSSSRYRNRPRIEHPISLSARRLDLYVQDEIYYDRDFRAWTRNEFALGGILPFSRRLELELYYMRRNDGRSRPGDLHIIGSVLRISFR